jgi:hypothetical protein
MGNDNAREGSPRIMKENGRFYIIGCDYGYLHNQLGSWANWATYSGAYSALIKLRKLKGLTNA